MITTANTKSTFQYAYQLVNTYARFDRVNGEYYVDYAEIDDRHLSELAALIMRDDPTYANEALGPDNDAYERSMLPALKTYLLNIDNTEAKEAYITAWQCGIVSYFKKHIVALLDEALIEYNDDHKQYRRWGA